MLSEGLCGTAEVTLTLIEKLALKYVMHPDPINCLMNKDLYTQCNQQKEAKRRKGIGFLWYFPENCNVVQPIPVYVSKERKLHTWIVLEKETCAILSP